MSNDTAITSLKNKIDDLNQQAWVARVIDSQKAFELSQESVKLARSINYPKGLAEGLRSLGFAYIRLFKNEEAAPLLHESLSLFRSLNDLKGQAIVYEYLGIIERNWGNLGASLEFLLKGNVLAQQTGPLEIEITSCYQVGVTYKHLGNHEEALDYLYKALSLSKKIDFTLMEAYATNIIGSIYFDNGDYNHALDCYQQSLIIRKQSHDKWGEAGSLDNIGFTYLKLNDLDKAIDYCKQSLAISQGTGDKKGEANALLHLAEIYMQTGDVKQASAFSNESLEIRKARGDKRGEAEVLLFLADLHKNQNDIEGHQIFKWLSGALKIAEEIKAQDLLSKAYYNLHEYHRQKENFKESLVHLEAHLQIEKELHKNTINQKVSNLEISHKAETISQRNKELTELNEKIEIANEELKIEASLERVRAVTMSMSKPDDILNICKVMFEELQTLGFKDLRNSLINFWDDDNNVLLDYDYSDFSGRNFAKLSYSSHPVFEAFQKKVRKATDAFAELVVNEDELETWKQRRRESGEYEDPRLNNISALYYYFYSTGVGALGISTFSPIPKDKLEVLKRFRNVFDLTYRRYLDIVKAEAQAREAQIEAALERVRSKTMAMHSSNDLLQVVSVVKEQLLQLGFNLDTVSFITDFKEDSYNMWLSSPGERVLSKVHVPRVEFKGTKPINEALQNGQDFVSYVLTKEEKDIYFKNFLENTVLKNASAETKQEVYNAPGMSTSLVLLRSIILTVGNFKAIAYTDDENNIIKRFGYVFEQSYIRFLDLQKAEAQAREAQIEVALERIRARAMAMHSSNELMDVASILREQMGLLDQPDLETSVVNLFEEDSELIYSWNASRVPGSSEKIISSVTSFPKNSSELTREMMSHYYSGEKEYTLEAAGLKLMEFLKVLIKANPRIADYMGSKPPEKVFYHFTTFTGGNLLTVSYQPPSEETKSLQRRAASVFDMAYRRYLDLKKAEAQAKEAQIEVALERVRSRTMAMHKSDELAETAQLLYHEFGKLGINTFTCGYMFIDEAKNTQTGWFVLPDGTLLPNFIVFPLTGDHILDKRYEDWKEKKPLHVFEIQGEVNKEHHRFLSKHVPAWVVKDIFSQMPDRIIFHCANFSYGYLLILATEFLSEEDQQTMIRFSKVFDLTYRRFLDLQKAETQAREAQIQLALERVRARTMAMQKSDELTETAGVMFQQLMNLGVKTTACGFALLDANSKSGDVYTAANGIILPYKVVMRYDISGSLNKVYDAWKEGKDLYMSDLLGKEMEENNMAIGIYLQQTYGQEMLSQIMKFNESNIQQEVKERSIAYHVYFSQGMLFFGHYEPIHEVDVLKRFAKVFEQTYTRFLDLQKAEAQARENQIQLALERARTQSMIMQHSNELDDTLRVFHEQVLLLGIKSAFSFLWLPDEEKDRHIFWAVWAENNSTVFKSKAINYPLDRNEPATAQCLIDWKGNEPVVSYHVPPSSVKDYFAAWNELIAGVEELTPENFNDGLYYVEAFMKYGCFGVMVKDTLPEGEKKILDRFAVEFERAYTRFLDLQKAEAQAREAQIEAALERVRARTMAMQKSDELAEVVGLLYKQFEELDFGFYQVLVSIYDIKNNIIEWWSRGFGDVELPQRNILPIIDHPFSNDLLDKWKNGVESYQHILEGEMKKSWDEHLFTQTDLKHFPEEIKNKMRSFDHVFLTDVFMKYGSLQAAGNAPLPGDKEKILKRFTKALDHAYTRMMDLQNAEAQTREAQIEAALERVRAKVMAMMSSKDLNETSLVFGEQLRKLGIDWQFSYFWLIDEAKNDTTFWITWPDYKTSLTGYTMAEAAEYFNDCLVAWRGGVKIHDNYVPPEDVQGWLDTFQRIADDAGGVAKEVMVGSTFPTGVYYYDAMMKYGSFGICISKPATDEEKKIQCRFAIEFERAYTRFLDLKQAEAQARESQIELGLERVRARAMAMQNSDELKELIGTVYTELTKLELILDRCFIMIYDNRSMGVTWWMSNPEAPLKPIGLFVKYHEQPPYLAFIKGWKERNLKWQYVLEGEVKKTWDKFLFVETELSQLPDFVIANMKANEKVYLSASFNNFGCLTLATLESLSDEHFDIMLRFAKVFDLTYTRFNDLKQAEAQTREAQIELGLERVRARAMAMQNSDELNDLVAILFEELTKLDLILARCIIWIFDNDELSARLWMANSEDKKSAESYYINRLQHSYYEAIIKGWKERNIKWVYDLKGDEKKTIDKLLLNETELSRLPDVVKNGILNSEHTIISGSFNNFGLLEASGPVELSSEQMDILSRFAKVFDLTYTRFNDLKQAEAQAREAKIEAALERVRAKAMAMHKSEDLNPAVATVFEELDKLNIGILRCGIAIMDKEKPRGDVWITVKSEQSNTIQVSGDESLDYHPLLLGAYKGWVKQEDFSYILQGDDLISYYRDVGSMKYQLPVSTSFDTEKKDQQQYYYNAVFQDGSLFAFMETAITDEAKTVIKRFANVFNLTYKRFLDLQKAEAQTREAKIEAALERVRARALAMQEPEELKDVAQVLRTEMGLLGVEELETCSIYINDEATNKTECWYALKDLHVEEKKLVSDHFPLNLNDTWVGREMKIFYRSDAKQVSIVMQGANRKEWINYCEERSIPFRGYYGEVIPDRTYHLYKFSHGAIGAAAAGDISAESWKLLSRAASVFSLAYSRFKDLTQARNDLIQLKEEKKRAEDALTELQTTQKQLIQAEKMASLGELTAGIAHEIQNPLNFVNNFSDVSNELLDEMKQELATGNTQQAIEIVNDVKENLEKILHHGKRADAIVKGMLQHSRSSSGHKESTDINVLADEYLRLAYHGLRAKDKFFNAKFETDLDPSIDKINIVPQEIGRVILNLINNSFYAVSEKKKSAGNGYEPTVIVSTKKVDDTVEIKVKDNGNGIPKKVLDKIFQPFFTTKPTGEGTGLGLSLSYDIITKGHDGEIKVETKEGEGSVFIISLPVK